MEYKIAKSFEEIGNSRYSCYFEVFLIPSNGYNVKRYLCKGYFSDIALILQLCDRRGREIPGHRYSFNLKDIKPKTDETIHSRWNNIILAFSRTYTYDRCMGKLRSKMLELKRVGIEINETIFAI